MRNRFFTFIISLLTLLSILSAPISVLADENAIGEVKDLVDGIVLYKSGSSNEQRWIDGDLKKNAGASSEWYILGLAQSGNYDFSSYEKALKNYLSNNTVYSATSRQKYALVLISIGSDDSYIASVLEDSIGNQGIMSWIYGLHLLNNGYTSSKATINSAKETLLSMQLSDGGWALKGTTGDVDVTAMAIQALAPYYKSDASVKKAVNNAISMLSSRQLDTGAYSSYGVPNPESTAQVITALACLGIDGINDSRFIKNKNTLLDGINLFRLSDGSFSHKEGGASNDTATTQVFYSMIAYLRMAENKGSLYILDKRIQPTIAPTKAPVDDEVSGTISTNSAKSTDRPKQTSKPSESGSTEVSTTGTEEPVLAPDGEIIETVSPSPQAETVSPSPQAETASPSPQAEPINPSPQAETASPLPQLEMEEEKVENKGAVSYKLWVSLGILVVAGISSAILFIKGKKNKKNFIFIAIAAVVLIGLVCITDFQTANDYYSGEDAVKSETVGTVSLAISCDTVVGKSDSKYIPADGVVLESTEFEIENGDTVYDILVEAAKKYEIQMENTGAEGMVYIAGINYLYEFDFGDLSGWMYFVNGEEPSVGCDDYVLKDGDKIEWLYTCELGNDL